jgi:GR25 family glycosyltransferase involved in LPS biosynthesis
MGQVHKHGVDYNGNTVRNLYRFLLQREVDEQGFVSYYNQNFDDSVNSLTASIEYQRIRDTKTHTAEISKKINYVVMKIDNRADETVGKIHSTLDNNFIYNEIEFFNYKISDVNKFYADRNMSMSWMADVFGLNKIPKIGEYACLASHIVALEYLIQSEFDELLVIEDDVILSSNFLRLFNLCYNDLPNDYDALADSTYLPNYQEFSTEINNILIDSKYICRAYLQNSHTGVILYSKQGAKKILERFKTYGAISAIDTYLFWLNRRDNLSIYTTFYSNKLIDQKDIYGSIGKD